MTEYMLPRGSFFHPLPRIVIGPGGSVAITPEEWMDAHEAQERLTRCVADVVHSAPTSASFEEACEAIAECVDGTLTRVEHSRPMTAHVWAFTDTLKAKLLKVDVLKESAKLRLSQRLTNYSVMAEADADRVRLSLSVDFFIVHPFSWDEEPKTENRRVEIAKEFRWHMLTPLLPVVGYVDGMAEELVARVSAEAKR